MGKRNVGAAVGKRVGKRARTAAGRGRRAMEGIAFGAAIAALGLAGRVVAAPLAWNGSSGGTFDTAGSWSPSQSPTIADDLTILGPGNAAGTLTINVATAANARTITFTNTSSTTLNNTTSGSNQTLTIQAGLTTGSGSVSIGSGTANQNVNVALGASQAWTIGSGNLTVTNVISGTGFSLTKAGTGTLTVAGANTFSGGLTIAAGQVTQTGTNNTSLGAANSTVVLGSAGSDATLLFTSTPSGLSQNYVIAAGAGGRTITSSNSVAAGSNGAVFAAANTVTLQSNLTVTETGSATGNIQFRGAISESGGTYGITVGNSSGTSVGLVRFDGANTFNGGVTVLSGTAQVNVSSAGTVASVTSGAFGRNVVTLGGVASANAATIAISGAGAGSGYTLLNGITVTSGGTRTITQNQASSSAGIVSGAISLGSADLNLTAVSTTNTNGADRLRIGSGGITGSGNIIINNSNTLTGAVAGSGAIRLEGTGSATAWLGNLIVGGGQGSLAANSATGANNTVGVASGALFNFSGGGSFSPVIAGLANASPTALGGSTGGTVFSSQNSTQTLQLGGSGSYVFGGSIVDGSSVIAANTSGVTAVAKNGSGTQSLSGANTYTGVTAVNGGTLSASSLTSGGTVSSVGRSTNVAANLVLNNGVLSYTGDSVSIDRGFTVNATNGGTIEVTQAGTNLEFVHSTAGSVATGTVGNPGALTKTGPGTLTLSGSVDNASFGLIVTAGEVDLNKSGTARVITQNGLTINGGAIAKLTGSGTDLIQNSNVVTVNNGTFDMNGKDEVAGTLTVGDAANGGNVIGGSTVTYTVSGSGTFEMRRGSVGVKLGGVGNVLNKTTAGAVTLSGANTYTGGTNISQGTLYVNAGHAGAGAYSVSGGTLAGNSSIATAGGAGVGVNAGGKLSPGSAAGSTGVLTMDLGAGSLDISGAVTTSASQAMVFDVTTSGSSDAVVLSNASSTLNIGAGVLEFDDFVFTAGPGVTAGTYTLIDTTAAITGSLGSNLSGTFGGSIFATLELSNDGQDLLLNVTAAPEPASLGLIAFAGMGLLARRRRRK